MLRSVIGETAHAELSNPSQSLKFWGIDQVQYKLVVFLNPYQPMHGVSKDFAFLFDGLAVHRHEDSKDATMNKTNSVKAGY